MHAGSLVSFRRHLCGYITYLRDGIVEFKEYRRQHERHDHGGDEDQIAAAGHETNMHGLKGKGEEGAIEE